MAADLKATFAGGEPLHPEEHNKVALTVNAIELLAGGKVDKGPDGKIIASQLPPGTAAIPTVTYTLNGWPPRTSASTFLGEQVVWDTPPGIVVPVPPPVAQMGDYDVWTNRTGA